MFSFLHRKLAGLTHLSLYEESLGNCCTDFPQNDGAACEKCSRLECKAGGTDVLYGLVFHCHATFMLSELGKKSRTTCFGLPGRS